MYVRSISFVDIFVSLSYLTKMIRDEKLLGVCGETELVNTKQSLITMMQASLKFLVGHVVFLWPL